MKTEDRATAEEPVETEAAERGSPRRELRTADIAEGQPISRERPKVDEAERDGATPLFATNDAERYRARWQDVQARFVDTPRESVEAADTLVAEVIKQLATVFADQQKELESAIQRDGKLSTEEFRIAFQRYRSFFDRLLSV